MIINFHIFYLSSTFTKNPLGLMTVNDLTLLNLNNYISDLSLKSDSNLYIEFKMNKNKNVTANGKFFKNSPLEKEQLCLFN